MTLRAWQLAALRGVSCVWAEHDRALVVAATGAGKTVLFGEVISRRKAAGRGRALVLAPRIALVDQAIGSLEAAGLSCEAEQGDRMASIYPNLMGGSDVVVSCVASLKGRRLERWPAESFATVVADEAHHFCAPSHRAIVDRFQAAKILGVTATPDRGDDVALGHVFPHLAFEYGIADGIRDGVLCPILSRAIDCPSLDLSSVRVSSQMGIRDLRADDLSAALTKSEETMLAICTKVAELAGHRQSLVFCPTVACAHEYRRMMGRVVGPTLVDSVDGSAESVERDDAMRNYREGRTRFLFNCQLYTEGTDLPATSCIVIARPTKSRALFTQMVGRGTRIAEGKTDLLVLTLHPSNEDHSLAKVVDLFAGDDLDEADRLAADRAIMSGEDACRVTSAAKEAAEARRRARERDTGERLTAQVKARVRVTNLFAEVGLDEDPRHVSGPRMTEPMRAALSRAYGRELTPAELSIKQASTLLDGLSERRKQGLCTIKQARLLARMGLSHEMSFDDARSAIDSLAASGWRMTPQIAEAYGT